MGVDDFFESKITWKNYIDQNKSIAYKARVNKALLTVRINDFPDDFTYTLFVNNREFFSFDEWPSKWNMIL